MPSRPAGETHVIGVTVAATCRVAVPDITFDALEPGCATRGVFAQKTSHYQK